MTEANKLSAKPKKRVRHSVPTVIQMEAVECGAASLAMILAYYGLYIPLEALRVECGVSRDGSKASNVVKVARNYGFEAVGMRLSVDGVKDIPLPAIIHWNFNHFVVLEGYDAKGFYLRDPGKGPYKVDYDEFNKSFTGIALTFKPTASFKKGGSKPNLIKALLSRTRGIGKELSFVGLTGFALIIPGLVIPIYSKIFIDQILISRKTDWLFAILIAMAGTAVVQGLATWVQSYYLLKLQTKLALTWSAKFFRHVLRLPMEFFVQRHPADISSRVSINDTVANVVSGQFTEIAMSVILAAFYLVLMFQYSVTLTLLSFSAMVLNLVSLKLSSSLRKDSYKESLNHNIKLGNISMTGLQSIETLKATASESDFFARWSGSQAQASVSLQKMSKIDQWVSSIPQALTVIMNNVVLFVAGLQIMQGDFTAGSFVAFQSLMASFSEPVNTLVGFASTIETMEADMNRIDDVLKYKEQDLAPELGANETSKLEGYVELKDVSFGYSRLEPPLIENFNLKLSPGSRVALVGASGSGKSTVAKLVSGLYKPWSGEIYLDGKKQEEVPGVAITNSIAVVDQEICMFSGTVKDNLTLWNNNISDDSIRRAAVDACIHDDITSIAKGYQADVSESGTNFSGGQKQRLEIARSLILDPTILILDEATSALDAVTEKKIDENVRKRGCTLIIAAHRLSTIRDADEIIVLEKGKIVERGTHDELVEKGGKYMQLIQME